MLRDEVTETRFKFYSLHNRTRKSRKDFTALPYAVCPAALKNKNGEKL